MRARVHVVSPQVGRHAGDDQRGDAESPRKSFLAIIPLGVLAFVMFKSSSTRTQAGNPGHDHKGGPMGDMSPVADAMPMTSVVHDAPVDAATPHTAVDAAIHAPPKPHPNTGRTHPPRLRPDAGTDEPSVDFYHK